MDRRRNLGLYEAASHLESPLLNAPQNSQNSILTIPHGVSSSLGWHRVSDTSPQYWANQDQARTDFDLGWSIGSAVANHGVAAAHFAQRSERVLGREESVTLQRLDPHRTDATRLVFSDHETFPGYAKDCHLYDPPENRFGVREDRLATFRSAAGHAGKVSLYPSQSSLYQTESNALARTDQVLSSELQRKVILCQERLMGNARNAESEIARRGSLIGLGELQRTPSFSFPLLSIQRNQHVYNEESTFQERFTIQPDLCFSEQMLRITESEPDHNLLNGYTGSLNRNNLFHNSVQLENSGSSYCQPSSSGLYGTANKLFPLHPHYHPGPFAENMPRTQVRPHYHPGAFPENMPRTQVRLVDKARKRKTVKRKKIGASHAKHFSSVPTTETKKLTSTAPLLMLFSTENENAHSCGGFESNKSGDTGLKQGWGFDLDVKSSPTWPNLEIGKATAAELVAEEKKELNENTDPNTVQNIQMIACNASRNFFESLEDDVYSDGSISDFEELDDDTGYPPVNDLEPVADNSVKREEKTYQFFVKLFEEDERIRKFYEENRNCGAFDCLVCFGAGTGIRRKYADLASLVQHAKTIIKTKRRFEHRGYFRAVSYLLGWLPSQPHPHSLVPRGCIPPMHEPSMADDDCNKVQEVPA